MGSHVFHRVFVAGLPSPARGGGVPARSVERSPHAAGQTGVVQERGPIREISRSRWVLGRQSVRLVLRLRLLVLVLRVIGR